MNRLVVIILIFILAGCERNVLPPSTEEVPQFKASGSLGGEEFAIVAGENNYFLDPTYERNSSGVYEFVAEFKKNNGDLDAFRISILDQQPRLPIEEVFVDAAVYSGFYELQSEQIELEAWKYQFYSFAGEDKDYLWNINGQEYTQNFPLIEIEPEVDLEVSLEISEAQIQCSDELSSTHEWTQSDDYVNYYYQPFEWEHVNGTGGVHFHFTEAGSDVTEINWIVDENGQLVTGQGLTLSHNFQTNGPHKVIINVVLSDGYTFRYAENIPAFESVETCAANFHFEPVPLQFEVAKVRIDYTDESGTRFSSLPDPGYEANGFFEIVSVNEFYNEQQASFTRKIEVVLSCTLFEIGNGDNTLLLEGFSGVMAVSFPQ